MAVHAYTALEADASVVRGTIVADTPRQARDMLRDRGLTIKDLHALDATGGLSLLPKRLRLLSRRRRRSAQVVRFIRELATLLAVGVPLLEAIETIVRQYHGRFRAVLLQLKDHISGGLSLAEAMRQQPEVFDEYCVSIVEVGENAGTLDVALKRLAVFKQRSAQLRGRIATALLYPAIVLSLAIFVSIFLMTFVVPKLLEGLIDAGRPIPAVTHIVKQTSDLLVHQWWLLLCIVLGLSLVAGLLLRTQRGRRAWDGLLLRTPILGELIRKQAVSRIATVIAELMRSGIVFLRAIQIAQNTTRNLIIREALGRCEQAVAAGREIAEALQDTEAFAPLVVQVFSVGQQSGRLEEMLDELAEDYDQQVATASARLTAVLEPLLILVMVAIVGLIAFATVLPMLEAGHVL